MTPPTSPPGPTTSLFDVWSRFYDLDVVQRLTYRPVHDAIVHALTDAPPARLLDVACGTGLLSTRLSDAFPGTQVVGCDFSRGMLAQATARRPDGPWIRADAGRLPFRSGCFEAVVCTEALHWFPDPRRALEEFRRVLAPDGRALVALVNVPVSAVGDAAHVVSRLVGQPFRWPTRAGMRALFEAAGLNVVAQRRIFRIPAGFLLPPVLTIGRPRAHRP